MYDWGSSPTLARAAVDILRGDGAPGWGDALEATISGDEKLVSSIWFGVQGAVAPLAVPQIRDTLLPRPGDPLFDPAEFLTAPNTLYLIGSAAGAAAMGGFLGALLDDIVDVARKKALASEGSRLHLPLGLILDEIVNMFRWGNLPRTMADGGGRGICTFVVLQALSQAETAWSKAEADTIWAAATAKVLLGGASHVDHLRDIETLLGTRDTRHTQRSWTTHQAGHSTSEHRERLPLMSVDEIRRMPQTLGLLAYRNRRGVLLDLAGWDERKDAPAIRTGKHTTETEQHTVFHTPTPTPSAAEARRQRRMRKRWGRSRWRWSPMSNRRRPARGNPYRTEFLASPAWHTRRAYWFRREANLGHPLACAACGQAAVPAELELHHRTYAGVLLENGVWRAFERHDDLIPLHPYCHELLHRLLDRDTILARHRDRHTATEHALTRLRTALTQDRP